ncbi:MAG: phospho-N-acetylmuramoyl-pentapeptide-transferase [Oscillospiraceae bacterium]|nr:phospho-N-acetylmuramoyl-pentapeptide-transferase [Oscillospiraceae bacterium]
MRYLQAFLISLVVTVLAGRVCIPLLRRLKAGQSIKRDGPVWHMSKEGTPTMGGIIFIAGILCAVLVTGVRDFREGNWSAPAMLAISLIYGAIGFIDDYMKVKRRHNEGLKGRQKFLLQLAAAVAFILLLRYMGFLSPNLYVPFLGVTLPLPEPVYVVFAAFVMVGTVNSVNLTDGVDGLVSGVSLPVAACLCALAAAWGRDAQGLFAAALAAGLLGFLVFNFHPAKVFMGDTGSLFLGGAICALAFGLDIPLILVPLGVVYICEALSDIIQVLYFKLSHGKRIFKMAPIHHHFEKCGWSEVKIFAVFSGVTLSLALLTFFCVRSRYGL